MYTVGIAVYDEVDEIELFGPYDVLSSVKKTENGHWTNDSAFNVRLVGGTLDPVKTSHGAIVQPQETFASYRKLDILIVPGGPGARLLKYPSTLTTWLCEHVDSAKFLVSLSTAAFIFARAGMLEGARVATYPAFAADIRRIAPKANVMCHERVVMSGGKLISTSGISNAYDAILALIERLEGARSAEIASRRIEWPVPIDCITPLYSS